MRPGRRATSASVFIVLVYTSIDASSSQVVDNCTISDTTAGLHDGICNGIHYRYNVPSQCVKSMSNVSCGLIADVHGWTMSGDIQNENTGTRELGEQYGFIVIQPTANKFSGKLPLPIPIKVPLRSWHAEDYPNVWAIVLAARKEANWNVDPGRVHFMGFSQGSEMTWHMLATYGRDIASAVPMSCAGQHPETVAVVAKDVPILYSHGYNDGLCDFAGGNATINTLKEKWEVDQGSVVSQDDHHIRTTYKGKEGQILETLFWDYDTEASICGFIYERIGKGHCFPGGGDSKCFEWDGLHYKATTSLPEKLSPFSCPADPTAAAFAIGNEAVQWFLNHHKSTQVQDNSQRLGLPSASDALVI